jgi:YspA, cpYpsA-related SLOG family
MRILITGSRRWSYVSYLISFLDGLVSDYGLPMTIVHGDCPTGVDHIVSNWLKTHREIIEEAHPADWDRYGRAAGPIRNQEMADRGADLCFGFPLGESRGTRDCMRRAEAAGIFVTNLGDFSII